MIVKIQLPLVTNEPEPVALVYNKDRSFTTQIPIGEEAKKVFGDDPKQFWKVNLDHETKEVDLIKRVRDRKW